MPDTVPAAAAPAAAAPSPTPTPSPETAPTPPVTSAPDNKKLAGDLFKLMTTPDADPASPQASQDRPDGKPKPAPTPAPNSAPAAAPEKPIKVKKKEAPAETPPPVPKGEAPAAPAAPKTPAPDAAAKPAPEDDTAFEKDLIDEEKALLEDARNAEKYGGDKFKGQAAKMTAFLKENVKKQAALDKGDLDQAEYEKWYRASQPKISVLDQRAIERARVRDDVKAEFEPKIAAEAHTRWTEAETPKVKAKGNEIYRKLATSSLPDEVVQAISERTKGIAPGSPEYQAKVKEVEKDYALEFEISQNIINAATDDLEELHRLTTVNPATGKTLKEFEATNPQHARLLTIVSDVCNNFRATGGAELKKDGKWFATREEWQSMQAAVNAGRLPADELKKWWTFTNDDIVDRAIGGVKGAIGSAVKAEHDRLGQRGFKRTLGAPSAPAAPTAPTPFGAPPAPRPTPPPAGGGGAAPSLASTIAGRLNTQTEG